MASLAFDATFYLTQNPDVATAIARGQFASAEDHYNQFGAFEGRNPNAYFDSAFYLAQNPDVLNARANPFQHFLQFGAAEGRFENNTADAALDTNGNNRADEFDSAAYLAANSDVANAISAGTLKSAYQHFVLFGQFEGRQGVTVGPFTNTGVAPNTGSTFTLTSGVDAGSAFAGTTANDTFIAGAQAGAATLSAGDNINGGAGSDTLEIINSAGAINSVNFAAATITSVERVNFTANATAQTLDVSANVGVTQVWAKNGTDSAITLAKTQTAGITGTLTQTAVQAFTFTSATGTADSASLALDGATLTAGVDIQGIETINVAATGANTLFSFDSDATKLVVTGAGSVDFGTLTEAGAGASLVTTIDASANTGGITVDNTSAAAAVETITGGSGADRYTTNFANLTSADKIDLGAGNDVLSFADATDLSTSTKAGVLAGVTNVEALRVVGTGTFAVDADVVAQSRFVVDTTGAFTGTNFSNTDTLAVGGVNTANSTVSMKLGQSTFNLSLEGSSTAVSDASSITVTGASTVNVSSSGVTAVGANNLVLATDANGTVNFTGSNDLVATVAVNSGTTGLSINGASFTGKLDIAGSANADVIVGGSGADTIRAFGNGVDTLTGNGGADKFAVFGADADTAASSIAVTDIITDFTSGVDKLIGGVAASASNYLEATATSATLAAFVTAADTALDGTVKYYVGQVGADTYVAYDDDGTGFTALVQINNVSLTGIAQADVLSS